MCKRKKEKRIHIFKNPRPLPKNMFKFLKKNRCDNIYQFNINTKPKVSCTTWYKDYFQEMRSIHIFILVCYKLQARA